MNEILILERNGDPDDGMFSCYTGTIGGHAEKNISTFWEGGRADNFIMSFLRKHGKSVTEYKSTEEVIRAFIDYAVHLELESPKENENGMERVCGRI